jgi:ketosteroid isomerase-like protein
MPAEVGERDVREAIARFFAAFNNLDWEAFRMCWSTAPTGFGATVFFPPPPSSVPSASRAKRLTGSDAEAVWRQTFNGMRQRSTRTAPPYLDLRPQDLDIRMMGDAAAVVTFHLGDETLLSRRTLVWKKSADGWKIVHLHGSAIELNR